MGAQARNELVADLDNDDEHKQCIRLDFLIVATAAVRGATTLISGDRGMEPICQAAGITFLHEQNVRVPDDVPVPPPLPPPNGTNTRGRPIQKTIFDTVDLGDADMSLAD